jgi:hypothetical protein
MRVIADARGGESVAVWKPDPVRIKAGKPFKLKVNATGMAPGQNVDFDVYELPYGFAADPVDTFQAPIDSDDPHLAEGQWTYDHAKLKDKVSGNVFAIVARANTAVSITAVEVVDSFEHTLTGEDGKPLKNQPVILSSARGDDLVATTDEDGKVLAEVPPGDYRMGIPRIAPALLPLPPPSAKGTRVLKPAPKPRAPGAPPAIPEEAEEAAAEAGEGEKKTDPDGPKLVKAYWEAPAPPKSGGATT